MFTIISRSQCNFCDQAKALLKSVGFTYEEYNVQQNPWLLTILKEAGYTTVPQVYGPTGKHIGGYRDLEEFIINGPE